MCLCNNHAEHLFLNCVYTTVSRLSISVYNVSFHFIHSSLMVTRPHQNIMSSCTSSLGWLVVALIIALAVTSSPKGFVSAKQNDRPAHIIHRRDQRETRYFVVDRKWEGALFYLRDPKKPILEERYELDEEGLTLEPDTSLVSKDRNFQWPAEEEEEALLVTVTRTDDSSCKYSVVICDVMLPRTLLRRHI